MPGWSRYPGQSGTWEQPTRESIPKVLDGLGTAVISTPKGLMTDKRCADLGLGGEILCYIW